MTTIEEAKQLLVVKIAEPENLKPLIKAVQRYVATREREQQARNALQGAIIIESYYKIAWSSSFNALFSEYKEARIELETATNHLVTLNKQPQGEPHGDT